MVVFTLTVLCSGVIVQVWAWGLHGQTRVMQLLSALAFMQLQLWGSLAAATVSTETRPSLSSTMPSPGSQALLRTTQIKANLAESGMSCQLTLLSRFIIGRAPYPVAPWLTRPALSLDKR